MADAVFARNEDHSHGTDAGHKEGIVIGPANHKLAGRFKPAASSLDSRHHFTAGLGRRIGVEQLNLGSNSAAVGGLSDRLPHLSNDPVTRFELRIANVDFQEDSPGNGVD